MHTVFLRKITTTIVSFSLTKTWKYIFPFSIALALFAIAYFLFGFYYETNDDIQIELFFRGITVPAGSHDLYYWYRWTSVMFVKLYDLFPYIPWYGLFLYALLIVSAGNVFLIIRPVFEAIFETSWPTYLIHIFFFFFILFESLLLLNFMRVTILTCASSFLLFFTCFDRFTRRRDRIIFYTYCFIVFALGFQIRPEGGLFTLGVLLPFTLLYAWKKYRSLKPVVYAYLLCAPVVIFGRAYDAWTMGEERQRDEAIIPFIQILHNYASPAYEKLTASDRVTLDVITEGFFWDRQKIDHELLERITPKHGIFSPADIGLQKISAASLKVVTLFTKNNLPMLLLNGLLVLLIILVEKRSGTLRPILPFLFFQLAVWGMIVGVAVIFKMPNRLLTPMLIVYTMAQVLYFGHVMSGRWPFHRSTLNFCLIVLLLGSCVFTYRTYKKITWYRERCTMNSLKLQSIENDRAYATVVLSKDALSLFNGLDPMRVSPLTRSKTYISSGWFNWYTPFIAQIARVSGSPEYIRFFTYLAAHSENHVFISTIENNAIQEKYFIEVYGRDLKFEKIPNESEFEELTYHYKLNFYKLTEN